MSDKIKELVKGSYLGWRCIVMIIMVALAISIILACINSG